MSELQNDLHTSREEWNTALLAVVSAAALLSILVYALVNCTDCYNSEVSTECHPATASTGAKWGGAGVYSAGENCDVNNAVLGAGFSSGEMVTPGEQGSHPLPYAMIPTQVPEAQGFRGYAPVEPVGAPAPGLRGYGAMEGGGSMAGCGGGQWGGGTTGQWGRSGSVGAGSQYLPGAHVSPGMTQGEEPPPSYYAPSYS